MPGDEGGMLPLYLLISIGVIELRSVVCAILALPVTILFATAAIIASLFSRRKWPTLVMRAWAKTLMIMHGVSLKVSGLEHVDPAKPAIYMANHASMVDIVILINALPVDLRFIFKHTILWAPFLGQAIWLMGMVPINRSNSTKASESLKKAGDQIRKGKHILIFPEGTRTRTGTLLPFKKGGFYLAIQGEVDIIPISVNNSQAICGRDSLLAKSGVIELNIHERISVAPYTIEKRNDLVRKVRASMLSDLKGDYLKTVK